MNIFSETGVKVELVLDYILERKRIHSFIGKIVSMKSYNFIYHLIFY